MDELRRIKMVTSQDPHENFIRAEQLRSDLLAHKDLARDRQYKYKDIGLSVPTFRLPFVGTQSSALTTFTAQFKDFFNGKTLVRAENMDRQRRNRFSGHN